MADLNQCTFTGRLGRDPEIRTIPSGVQVANFSIAVGSKYKDKQSGEWVDKVEWVKCVAWARLAEIIGQYLVKGSQVAISGELQTRSWEKDDEKRYTTEVVVRVMNMMGGKSADQQQPRPKQSAGAPSQGFVDDADVPF